MAGGQERVLRRRISSIQSTKKITRAMELISASQIVRATSRIAGSRPYLHGIETVVRETAADSPQSRLLGVPESPTKVLAVVIVSDRGLCGGYNNFVLRAAERMMAAGRREGREYRVFTVGRKAEGYFRFRKQPLEHSFRGMTDRPRYEDAQRLAAAVVPPFLEEEVELVQVVSTRFVSAGTQVVETRQLLPILPAEAVGGQADGATELLAAAPAQRAGFFEFEPDAQDLMPLIVPRYAEAALFGALLEASASEHTARQRAMSAATENADELIKTLTRTMNRARQESITTEIMEIVGGAEALRQSQHEDNGPPERELTPPEEQIA